MFHDLEQTLKEYKQLKKRYVLHKFQCEEWWGKNERNYAAVLVDNCDDRISQDNIPQLNAKYNEPNTLQCQCYYPLPINSSYPT